MFGLGAAVPVSAAQLGQIVTRDGYRYQITPTDLLWLGRALQFEGGDPVATLWTYTQRQAKMRWKSLTSLVRAHSQPVNPKWDNPDDPKCVEHPDRCQPHHIERRRRARTTPWEGLDPAIRELLVNWAQAKVPNPVPGAVDFAAPGVSKGFLRRTPGSKVVEKAGNWYIAVADSLRWPMNYATVAYKGRKAPVDIQRAVPWQWLVAGGVGVAGAAVLAYVGYQWWRGR